MSCSDFSITNNEEVSITVTDAKYTETDNGFAPGVYVVTITGTANGSDGPLSKTTTIEITLVDPCDPPTSVTSTSLTNQEYRLADMSGPTYTHGEFTVVPSFCPLTYTYSETKLVGGEDDTAISRVNKIFTFSYDKDDAPVNPVAQTQTVTVTATSDSLYTATFPSKSDSASFDLTFVDPCSSSSTSSVTIAA
jgi:hypothetical protein